MGKKAEFVQLESSDDIGNVRDRLSFIRGKRVLLIWPEEGTALIRKLDLVLVQREAMRRAIQLALVTHDPIVIKHADELNISTFETIGASERGRWKRGRTKVFTGRFQKPKDEPEPEALMDVASRVRTEEAIVSRLRRTFTRGIVLVLLLGVTGAAAYIVVPGATVTITLAEEIIEVETEIIADSNFGRPDPDIENAIIPATLVQREIEGSGTIETSGTQDFDDVVATGSVVFVNQTSGEIVIPAATTVSTSAGTPILFRTTDEVIIPAGSGQQVEAPIEAMQSYAGGQGNVDSGLINTVIGPLESTVTVRNLSPTVGGENRSLSVITADDQDRLRRQLLQQLQTQAVAEMESSLGETQFVILETVEARERADWTTFSAEAGQIADTLTLDLRVVVEALAVDEQFARQVVFAGLSKQMPRRHTIRPETISYQRGPVLDVGADGRVTFIYTGSARIAGQANTALLQEQLAGRSTDDALQYLTSELDLASGTTPQIRLSPGWFNRLPVLPIRIDIRLATPQ